LTLKKRSILDCCGHTPTANCSRRPTATGWRTHATDTLSTVFFFLLLFFQLMKRPAKYSKELLDWRRRQNMLARQKNYAEAQKIKRIADVMEEI
jgi:hypothetical protein